MDIDYNKLAFFLEVVRSGSVTGAAKRLHRTQSAVSQAIQALEKQLGVILITWEGKRLQLTREGFVLFEAANQRLQLIDEELLALKLAKQEVTGCIELGMLNDQSSDMQERVVSTIVQFRKEHPSVSFKIHFDTSANLEKALLENRLDIALLINFQKPHRFRLFEIATEQHLIVTTPAYLKSTGPIKSVQDVVLRDLIDIDSHFTCFTPWLVHHDPAAAQEIRKKKPIVSVPDFRLIKSLILTHQGIAVLPKHLIEEELETGAIVCVLSKLVPLRVWVHAAVENGRDMALRETLFLKWLSR